MRHSRIFCCQEDYVTHNVKKSLKKVNLVYIGSWLFYRTIYQAALDLIIGNTLDF
jgi:hypothetical protein